MVTADGLPPSGAIDLDEIIHQPTRLQIMSLLVSLDDQDRLAYGFVQKQLELTPGNLTTHLRKLEDADYVATTKEFHGAKPRTWIEATAAGRTAFAVYLQSLERALGVRRGR